METASQSLEQILQGIPTDRLIALLQARHLSPEHVQALQALKAVEDTPAIAVTPEPPAVLEAAVVETRGVDQETDYTPYITRRNVEARLAAGTILNGTALTRRDTTTAGAKIYGDEKLRLPLELERWRSLHNAANQKRYDKEKPDSHFVAIAPSVDRPGYDILTILFLQDPQSYDSRGRCSVAGANIEMSHDHMLLLQQEMSTNPDVIERVYQQAFPLLDYSPGHEGMRRVPARNFIFAQGEQLQSLLRAPISPLNAESYISQFPHIDYQRPYGTGQPLSSL